VRNFLVVDDDVVHARLLGRALDRLGDRIIANSARDAIALLEESRNFSFLLVDVKLDEGETGFSVVISARNLGYRRPIFLISGYATSEMLEHAEELDCPLLSKGFHIEKPIGREALFRKILWRARIPIDASDPRLLAEFERCGIRSTHLRAMLVGIMNRRKKAHLLEVLDLTKDQWHRRSHRLLVKLSEHETAKPGQSLRRAARALYLHVLAKPRALTPQRWEVATGK
jgi:CheY-like chemotaxis protein